MSAQQQTAARRPQMRDWPSTAYWRESDTRIKQFWYVSFCLMMSSAQDRLTGIALRENGNLNWATTAFYYSAVHAGRLVCFVCCGDYPTGHAELANLLAPMPTPQRPPRRFHFDWLDRFRRYVGANQIAPAQNPQAPQTDHDALVAAIDATLPNLRAAFDRFALLPAKFKNLRNDCNYEALLVAHERNHHIVDHESHEDRGVTQGFQDLVASAEQVSRLAVDLAIDAYLKHLQNADYFGNERERFHAAHCQYLHGRFENSLRQKFQHSPTAMAELQRITDRLGWPGEMAAGDLGGFLAPIMYDTFGEKQGLMQRWRDDIAVLHHALNDAKRP